MADNPLSTGEIPTDTVPGAERPLRVEFAGEWFTVSPRGRFTIGREGDLEVDDNQYLHRHFLELSFHDGLWWLANVGSRLAATVSSAGGAVQSWLSPGARMPVVFAQSVIVFTAGPTTYEIALHTEEAHYAVSGQVQASMSGEATVMPVSFTPLQRVLIVALAEPMLRREGVSVSELPSSSAAAARLGWTMSKFNRKLDNVCDKLDRMGVQGLRGGPGKLATNRRARLVEYAVSSQLVTRADLPLLDDEAVRNAVEDD
ncbi:MULTISPECIES: FHA domain-containing protein [Microbacterium]|uniref:FHA domain-containing protein n=1 Tax=Microbacterium gilvum TaxID=1336204 RepID=A0ABP9A2D1_9MICO